MDAAQQIVANNDRMFRELFGFDANLLNPTDIIRRHIAETDAKFSEDAQDALEAEVESRHKSLCLTAGVCACGQEPTEEEVEAAR